MEPFSNTTGLMVPMERANVDTDQIIPAVFLKSIERSGFGPNLFYNWRFLPDGSLNSDFILNAPEYQGASILVTGKNFGCGSSREHAVWALMDYGIRAIIGTSFAEIFHKNCLEMGLVPVLVPEETVTEVMGKAQKRTGSTVTVDLEQCLIMDDEGLHERFVVHNDPQTHEFRRHCLLNGLDEIGLTLEHVDKILQYEQKRGLAE